VLFLFPCLLGIGERLFFLGDKGGEDGGVMWGYFLVWGFVSLFFVVVIPPLHSVKLLPERQDVVADSFVGFYGLFYFLEGVDSRRVIPLTNLLSDGRERDS